jgi:chloramphenicol 3-O-phosphotransferase
VNGPSSAGKSTLCSALQDRLVELAEDQGQSFAKVAFDDFLGTLSTRYYPRSFTELLGGDTTQLTSKVSYDGKAGWEYVDESEAEGRPGEAWVRLAFSPESDRLLVGQYRGWGCHLELGTNLLVDAFLQDKSWADELLAAVKRSGARLLLVGVHCTDSELEQRELKRGDRPRGLARRSSMTCHSHGLVYAVKVQTDQDSTDDSVAAIVTALQHLQGDDVQQQLASSTAATTTAAPATPPAIQPMTSLPLVHRSGTELIALLHTGAVSATQLLEAFLARAHAANPAVNAIVVLDTDAARARAAELDERRARGETLGPLHGE